MSPRHIPRWVFRLQHKLSMTHNEFLAITIGVLLLLVGQVARQFLMDRTVYDADYYREKDSLFFALSGAAVPLDTITVGRSDSTAIPDSLYAAVEPDTHSVDASRDSVSTKRPPEERTNGGGRIDVNRASLVELTRLPGIGPRLAERIVNYRNKHGRFLHVDDLQSVAGIGPKKLETLAPFVIIRP